MEKYFDTESGEIITARQLFREYLQAHKNKQIDNGISFAWYTHNSLTSFGGTLQRIRE